MPLECQCWVPLVGREPIWFWWPFLGDLNEPAADCRRYRCAAGGQRHPALSAPYQRHSQAFWRQAVIDLSVPS